MIANSKNNSKNIRNTIPTTYSPLIQSSINLEEDNVVLGDNNNIERLISKKITKKTSWKNKASTSSHVESILEDYKEHKTKMKCKKMDFFFKSYALEEEKGKVNYEKTKI